MASMSSPMQSDFPLVPPPLPDEMTRPTDLDAKFERPSRRAPSSVPPPLPDEMTPPIAPAANFERVPRRGGSPSGMPRPIEQRSKRPSVAKRVARGLTRFLIVFCIGVAATLGWQTYGDEARQMIASSSPQLGWLAPQAAPVG